MRDRQSGPLPGRLSTASSADSQREAPTAVNTPGWASPASAGGPSRRGSACMLATQGDEDSGRVGKLESDTEAGCTKIKRDPWHLSPTETGDTPSEPEKAAVACGIGADLDRLKSAQATELELRLKERVRSRGLPAHARGEDAGLERREMVDLGNGPEDVIIVEWLADDPEDPFNWSPARKYATILVAVLITALTAGNATSTAPLAAWGPAWLHVEREAFEGGLAAYLTAIAVTPLVLAPMSELFGRNAIYQVTSIVNALLFLPQILSHSYGGYIAARWFQGMASSVGNSMVGGTIADILRAEQRGLGMNVFALIIFLGQGTLATAAAWVGTYGGYQWAYGFQAILAGVSIVLNALVLRETRADVLLSRRARRLTKATGVRHVAAADLQRRSVLDMIRVSTVRPLQYLITEPIVTAVSLWIGFAWSIIFLGGTAVLLVFESYGFSLAVASTFELTLAIGGLLGFVANLHQERLYARARARSPTGRAEPEARLYWGAAGGVLFPAAMLVFAWTGRPEVHWAVPAACLCVSYMGVYCMYSSVFTYLADAYETYSSSAQASHSFVRNVFSGLFPLFARQMYINLTYPVASTVVAAIAAVLSAAPVLLILYGARLRARSRVASALEKGGGYGRS
ncbi:hypothetical protein Q5752_006023 [Cryptotrichosporon argae]